MSPTKIGEIPHHPMKGFLSTLDATGRLTSEKCGYTDNEKKSSYTSCTGLNPARPHRCHLHLRHVVFLILFYPMRRLSFSHLGLLESSFQDVQRPLSAVVGLQLPLNVFHPGQRQLQVLLELLQHGGCDWKKGTVCFFGSFTMAYAWSCWVFFVVAF